MKNIATKIIINLLVFDQGTKSYLISYFKNNSDLTITCFLKLTPCWNQGVSFGLFKDYFQHSNTIFIILNTIVILYLWILTSRIAKTIIMKIAYSLIIGGGLSNIIDRLLRGAVFDFICFHYKGFNFPIFNLADVFISLGALILFFIYYKEGIIISKFLTNFR